MMSAGSASDLRLSCDTRGPRGRAKGIPACASGMCFTVASRARHNVRVSYISGFASSASRRSVARWPRRSQRLQDTSTMMRPRRRIGGAARGRDHHDLSGWDGLEQPDGIVCLGRQRQATQGQRHHRKPSKLHANSEKPDSLGDYRPDAPA